MEYFGDRGVAVVPGDPKVATHVTAVRECIFRPGNLVHLAEGRLHDLVTQVRRDESFIVCHAALPHYRFPGVKPAISRGFADRYSAHVLQVFERLFGFIEVDPPCSANCSVFVVVCASPR
jgi:hypothetical protein